MSDQSPTIQEDPQQVVVEEIDPQQYVDETGEGGPNDPG